MIAGKHCNPILLYVAMAVVVLSLVFLALKRGRDLRPQSAPLHEQR